MRTPRHHYQRRWFSSYPDPYAHYRPRRTRLVLPLLIGVAVLAIALTVGQPDTTTTGPATGQPATATADTAAGADTGPATATGQVTEVAAGPVVTGGHCPNNEGGQP